MVVRSIARSNMFANYVVRFDCVRKQFGSDALLEFDSTRVARGQFGFSSDRPEFELYFLPYMFYCFLNSK